MLKLMIVSLSAACVTFACLALTPAPSHPNQHEALYEDVEDLGNSFSI